MNWETHLHTFLREDFERNLQRSCAPLPAGLVNFGSNDYLGFSDHPDVIAAARMALEKVGMGPRAARLVTGHTPFHEDLETTLATFKQTEDALTFTTGYMTPIGVISSIMPKTGIIVLDESAHACLWDGARLAGCRVRVSRHNDLTHLGEILKKERESDAERPILIVAESIYSMDGDGCELSDLVECKERWGAWLLLDEAHATGVFGPGGQGKAHPRKLAEQVELQMGTLGKAIGAQGGFVAGSQALIQVIRQRARSFIFSTAAAAPVAAAARAGINLITSAEGVRRRKHLSRLIGRVAHNPQRDLTVCSQIIPIPVGEEADAVKLSTQLQKEGFYVPAIRYPTVPKGKSRLRLSLSAVHREQDIDRVLELISTHAPTDIGEPS